MIHVKPKMVKGWSTHNYILIKCLMHSTGPVAEVGSGLYSTPLLHWICRLQNRKLVTFEDTKEFYDMAHVFTSRSHKIHLLEDWDDMDVNREWGVVLIDHTDTDRRATDIIRFKDTAQYIVIHDTEKPEKYGYDKVWEHFKYVYHWKGCKPWTSVVSNFQDLAEIEE